MGSLRGSDLACVQALKEMKGLHYLLGFTFALSVSSCQDEDIMGAVVATKNATEISNSSPVLNGELLEIGTFPVTNPGFQLSADSSTVVSDVLPVKSASEIEPGQIGIFSLEATDLKPGTQYFFRAVAETGELPSFGEILSFKIIG